MMKNGFIATSFDPDSAYTTNFVVFSNHVDSAKTTTTQLDNLGNAESSSSSFSTDDEIQIPAMNAVLPEVQQMQVANDEVAPTPPSGALPQDDANLAGPSRSVNTSIIKLIENLTISL